MIEKKIVVVAAVSLNGAYGTASNMMLWKCPKDLERFRKLTTGHTVVMGRNTWDSLPDDVRPLPDRDNIVITSRADFVAAGATVVSSWVEAIRQAKTNEIYFIGGRDVWGIAMNSADEVYITVIMREFPKKEGTLFAPEMVSLGEWQEDFILVNTEKEFDEDPNEHVSFHVHFEHWVRKNG